ncbi:MAG: response regulator transcription factor [Lachnospiraceae bacterium]|nr:response regulator transcription factor [Lachnospiraceae bacterium]
MMDILIIEDNEELGQLIYDFITNSDYSADLVKSAEDALKKLEKENYRLLLLDVMLPGLDGFNALSKIRKDHNMPVLMMSARTDDDSKILGMETGADDYIEKPFSVPVLLSKIKALLRRAYGENENDVLTYKNIRLNVGARTVTKDGKSLEITGKEFDILEYLMKNVGKVVDKNKLFDEVWGFYSDTEMSSLNVYVRWLREKIEDDPKEPEYIKTVWRVGYKFGE